MNLEAALSELGLLDCQETIRPHWEESQAAMPEADKAGAFPFLDPAAIRANGSFFEMDPALYAPLDETARRIRGNPALLGLAWHAYYLFHRREEYRGFSAWPSPRQALGPLNGMFYLLIALTSVPPGREVHRRQGIPEQVTRDAYRLINESIERRRFIDHGNPGVCPRNLVWLRNQMAGLVYRLGRLDYMTKPFRGLLKVYRHRRTGETIALAADGAEFTAEGFMERASPSEKWKATLVEDGETIAGYPISPFGVAVRRKVALSAREWARRLETGDAVLDVHIPSGGAMTLEKCRESMQMALEFFPRYVPQWRFRGFGCMSWILDTQIQEMFPPTANMPRFQRETYLHPHPSTGREGLYFIFVTDSVDPATAPRDTSLRRAYVELLEAGKRPRNGGMFILTEDFARFGTEHYRRHWPPAPIREFLA
ncbi:MAG: acyltransferase domain-containing protein [Candidatus Sumerlaeota bacterium]|nr:acyltransferase domain-containing protein [Candidatus Sumerlaeota bacterium]